MTMSMDEGKEKKTAKKNESLLDKALKVYGCDPKYVTASKEYPNGREDETVKYLNPKFSNKKVTNEPKYIVVTKPTVTFLTQGGQKRHYFEGMEKMEGDIFYWHGNVVSFEALKLSQTQCDGISRLKLKRAY